VAYPEVGRKWCISLLLLLLLLLLWPPSVRSGRLDEWDIATVYSEDVLGCTYIMRVGNCQEAVAYVPMTFVCVLYGGWTDEES
jgi:hypothetical protein